MYDRLPISLNLPHHHSTFAASLPVTGLVRLLIICSAAGAAFAARADVVRWLYDVEVQVASQSVAERQRAARAGLAEVLRRVSGMAELPAHPDLTTALRRPDSFYSRYNFVVRESLQDGEAADEMADETTEQTFLAIQFEPGAVLSLLRRTGLPVWAANRPTVLAWVAVQRDGQRGQRELISANADAFADALASRSRERGLELSLPLMDMADLAIAASDVWGLFWEEIERASARYGADLLAVGRVRQDDDGSWTSDWHLRSRAGQPRGLYDPMDAYAPRSKHVIDVAFERRSESAAEAARAALDGVADALASRFAVRGDLDAVALVVRGIDSVSSYASLLRYLHSREYVERLEVRVVQPDALTLGVHSRSGPEQLRELLVMGGELGELPGSKPVAGALELSWRGSDD